jgi:hypothetical protein
MNKMVIKNLVIFVVGAGVGALLTYQFVKTKYEAVAQEEIDSVKEVFARTDKDRGVFFRGMTDEEYEEYVTKMTAEYDTPAITDERKNIIYRKPDKKTYTRYNDMVTGRDGAVVESFKEHDEEIDPVRVISLDEFNHEHPEFDKITINYYDLDDTLADEQEEVISNPDYIVGPEALLNFGQDSEDPDIVYVRNCRLSIDYEVVRVNQSYMETVMGIVDDTGRPVRRRIKDE